MLNQLTDKLPDPSEAILAAVDKAVVSRWPAALERTNGLEGLPLDEQVRRINKAFARELATVGAVSGGVAAVPGAGTAAAVALSGADIAISVTRTTDLILSIGAAHGLTQASVEDRRAWVLAILAYQEAASQGFTKLASELGKGLGKKATAGISTEALRSINRALGRTIITKYGSKRGAIAIGRALPFGIGAVIGGGSNYWMTRGIGRHANRFFLDLPEALRHEGAG